MWTAAGGQERLRLTTRWFWGHCTALFEGLATDSLNHRVFDRFILFLPTTDGGSGPRDRQHFQLNVRGAHKFTLFTNPRGIQGIQGVVHDEDDDGAEAAANPWANKIHSWKSIIKSWFYFWSEKINPRILIHDALNRLIVNEWGVASSGVKCPGHGSANGTVRQRRKRRSRMRGGDYSRHCERG